jgi:hypothetical protein
MAQLKDDPDYITKENAVAEESPTPTPKRRGYPPKTQPSTPSPAPRTKRAYIELFVDEGTACICHAFPAEQYEAHDVGDSDLFNAMAGDPCNMDSDDTANAKAEQEATLAVLGWLWQHGYASATWGEQVYGEGKPPWATKDTYEWGDAPTSPDPKPTTKKEDTMSSTTTPPDPTTRAENYAARLRITTTDSPEFKEVISEATTEAIQVHPPNFKVSNKAAQIIFADGSGLHLAPGKGGITTWRVVAPIPSAPKEKREPQVGDYYIMSDGAVVYVSKVHGGGAGESGYCSIKYQVPGTQNQRPLFTQEILLDITRTSKLLTEEEFKAQFPWLVKPLDDRKANPDLTVEDAEKTLTLQAAEKVFTALEAKPEYIEEVDEVKRLAPEWLKVNGTLTKSESDLESAEGAFEKATHRYNSTKADRDAAKAEVERSKAERNRIDMQLGQRWFNLRKLMPTAQWSVWLTAKAQAIAPNITTEEIIKQLKLFEDYSPVQPELRDQLIALGAKPTKATLEMVKQVMAEMPVLTEEAKQKVANLGSKPTESPSDEAKMKLSEMAAAVVQRTKSKVTAIRSAAGQLGGAGNKADKTLAPITIPYTPEDRWLMAYNAVAEQIKAVPHADQHDWMVALCCRCFGLGLGEHSDITISPIVLTDWENPTKASYIPFGHRTPLVQTAPDETAGTAGKRPQASKETLVQRKKGAAS